ncbi:hypothetical protein EGR_10203 [Echinococcus granulosus]|uniref:Uncharacterized protein n=1 Tax=Echinococcus granulosus TaxID=6210 RepID=W6U1J3_ECHGR|nr:hypothetical protein EGR_10203 [Echinococcus granulosus]EUB54945.1 hypothetical protein EGR_10203 [Echinococcus granulosus]
MSEMLELAFITHSCEFKRTLSSQNRVFLTSSTVTITHEFNLSLGCNKFFLLHVIPSKSTSEYLCPHSSRKSLLGLFLQYDALSEDSKIRVKAAFNFFLLHCNTKQSLSADIKDFYIAYLQGIMIHLSECYIAISVKKFKNLKAIKSTQFESREKLGCKMKLNAKRTSFWCFSIFGVE